MKRCRRRFSSVEAVSHCDELVNEILIRLPLDAVCKFKCVSKKWNSLISHPLFCSNYLSQRKNSLLPLLGFFRVSCSAEIKFKFSFLQNCKEKKFTSLDLCEDYLLGSVSPEGLILWRSKGNMVLKFYVCNPVTNQWLTLPEPRHAPSSQAFSCEECSSKDGDGVVHFKVTLAIIEKRVGATYDGLHLETFSSRTGEWSESFITSPSEFSDDLDESCECHSVGGILYWKVSSGYLAAYDPNMGENRLWLIELPPPCLKKRRGFSVEYVLGQASSRDGCLLRFAINVKEKSMIKVLELKKKLSSYSLSHIIPSSEWVLKEEVSLKKLGIGNCCRLMVFHPRDAKLVYLKQGRLVFCYDFETRRLEAVEYHGTALPNEGLIPYFQPPWRPSLPCITWTLPSM
ncbi:F-box protein At5g03970-like [Cornus florida]|uniref:F-box protein At5g03970-like n=1 Tax=Cornus florida TaxID=4283 RepID=UPI0028996293|nr:F-box protein At5g03970-like [Cornus florida]